MRKYRFVALFLGLALCLGTLSPATLAAKEDSMPAMSIAATSALLMDAQHGEIVYEQNAHERVYPASVTKVMTALLVVESIGAGKLALTDLITADASMNDDLTPGGSTQNIKVGETLTVDDLLHCLLVASANEAANILGRAVAGDHESFIALMNQRAAELGCKDTNFVSAHGLHDPNHYSTAYDIYIIAKQAMLDATFRRIVAVDEYRTSASNLGTERHFYNTNALITGWRYPGYTYKYATGIKTGSTDDAGQCLVSSADYDGRSYIAVVMGAQNAKKEDGSPLRMSFVESKRLFEWGFANFSRRSVLDTTKLLGQVDVTLASDVNYVGLQAEGTLEATVPTSLDLTKIKTEVVIDQQSIPAPVTKGQVLGSVTVSYDGTFYGTLPLVAVAAVERSELLYRLDQVGQFFGQLWVKLLLVVLLLAAVVLLVRWLFFSKRRRYGGRRYR